VRGGVAASALDLPRVLAIADGHADERSDSGAVGLRAGELYVDPGGVGWRFVGQHGERLVGVRDGQVEPAVVVKVGTGDAAAHVGGGEVFAGLRGHVVEP